MKAFSFLLIFHCLRFNQTQEKTHRDENISLLSLKCMKFKNDNDYRQISMECVQCASSDSTTAHQWINSFINQFSFYFSVIHSFQFFFSLHIWWYFCCYFSQNQLFFFSVFVFYYFFFLFRFHNIFVLWVSVFFFSDFSHLFLCVGLKYSYLLSSMYCKLKHFMPME